MSERHQIESEPIQGFAANAPVPVARPLSDFAVESVGDELVIFDVENLHYHTLNLTAQLIWQACNGSANPSNIGQRLGIPTEVVELTIAELGEAGLLVRPSSAWDVALGRRRAGKLLAAGLIGVAGLPMIKSITVPESAAAASCPNGQCVCCNPDGTECSGCIGHGSCKSPKVCF